MDDDLQRAYRRLRAACRGLQQANESLNAAEREHRLALDLVEIYERRSIDWNTRAHSASTEPK